MSLLYHRTNVLDHGKWGVPTDYICKFFKHFWAWYCRHKDSTWSSWAQKNKIQLRPLKMLYNQCHQSCWHGMEYSLWNSYVQLFIVLLHLSTSFILFIFEKVKFWWCTLWLVMRKCEFLSHLWQWNDEMDKFGNFCLRRENCIYKQDYLIFRQIINIKSFCSPWATR